MSDDPYEAVTVTAGTRSLLEGELDRVVTMYREQAVAEGLHGILVTHVAPGRSRVSISQTVPFGLTREVHAW
ncbi:hypothetical protein Q9R30_14195 [Arthrobacter sp. AB6]|uniref:hypothetical protein n=1 Tax=Arthrobacter sp. AB6 TaxID=2962570 RepID=UPI00288158DB|nr:hypothetical protein [Arthrobacter sp. AB6]MDT0196510.1 hypothetical protein [Arthrobacter sp. AB6]